MTKISILIPFTQHFFSKLMITLFILQCTDIYMQNPSVFFQLALPVSLTAFPD